MQVIDINVPIETSYCIDEHQRDLNVKYSISQISNRVVPGDLKTDSIAVVCYGPSLLKEWDKIKKYKYIMTCSGGHDFLIEKGIIPTWHIEVDPRPHKVDLITPHSQVEYLLASAVNKNYIDACKDYNTKLWHIYPEDTLEILPTFFPRGEWIFAGGCTVGLRAVLMSRFLGFTNIDVFGMDCSYDDNVHAGFHPNPPKENSLAIVNYCGINYKTTVGMVEYAREFFKQYQLLLDCKISLYGEGLLQHMVSTNWKLPAGEYSENASVLAVQVPNVITKDYLEQQQLMHNNINYGAGGYKWSSIVLQLINEYGTNDVLDYGCGKGTLKKTLCIPEIREYDPAIKGKDLTPLPANIVVCTDVLEHIEPELIDNVLGDLARCTKKIGFFLISTRPAVKYLPDGRNAHIIQQTKSWWHKKISNHFIINEMIEDESSSEIKVWVVSKAKAGQTTTDQLIFNTLDTENIKFVMVNEQTKWRALSIRQKEPVTYEWLKTMNSSDIFFDVGANMGVYSLWAAINRKVRTYAFEPESQNFALLNQNIYVNKVYDLITALPISLSDKQTIDTFNLVEFSPASSCHQLGSNLNYNGKPFEPVFKQGTVSFKLDDLVKSKMLPQPTHIKIDVDGLEPNIIRGSIHTLTKVKSILVEVNGNLESHKNMVNILKMLQFKYDENQVRDSMRQTGLFKGVAEYVFFRD